MTPEVDRTAGGPRDAAPPPGAAGPGTSRAPGVPGPRIGSLCTGFGGLDMAITEVLGGTVAWHADNDPDAARVLAHHWPGVLNHGDITAVDWAAVEPVDVVTAGFPCQDISYAGRGAGIRKGNRSGLWHVIADAIGVLRPRIVVLENVRAIVARRPGLDVVLADLARLGFDAEWTCVRASDVGAPHRRERWFLAAHPANLGHERDRSAWRRRSGSPDSGLAVADAGRPGCEGAGPAVPERRPVAARRVAADVDRAELIWERLEQPRGATPARDCEDAAAHTSGRGYRNAGPPSGHRLPAPAAGGAAADPDGRGRRPDEQHLQPRQPDPQWGAYGPAIRQWERALGRPAPAATEPGRSGPRLSPPFVEWLMGLPAGHVTAVPGLSRNAMLRILGNGVVPQQGAQALRSLLAAMREEAAA